MNVTFWDVTSWISVGRYHHTGGISNLCIQGRKLIQQCTLRMEQLVPSKCWYLFCKLRGLRSLDSTHRFLFFLLWFYNYLCRVLAFSTNSFHLLLSWTRIFQFGTFSFCIFFLTPSSQRTFYIPIGLFEMGFQECIALNILVSCILSI